MKLKIKKIIAKEIKVFFYWALPLSIGATILFITFYYINNKPTYLNESQMKELNRIVSNSNGPIFSRSFYNDSDKKYSHGWRPEYGASGLNNIIKDNFHKDIKSKTINFSIISFFLILIFLHLKKFKYIIHYTVNGFKWVNKYSQD